MKLRRGELLTDVTCARLRALNARGMQAAKSVGLYKCPGTSGSFAVSVKGAAGRTSGGVLQYVVTGGKEKKKAPAIVIDFMLCSRCSFNA